MLPVLTPTQTTRLIHVHTYKHWWTPFDMDIQIEALSYRRPLSDDVGGWQEDHPCMFEKDDKLMTWLVHKLNSFSGDLISTGMTSCISSLWILLATINHLDGCNSILRTHLTVTSWQQLQLKILTAWRNSRNKPNQINWRSVCSLSDYCIFLLLHLQLLHLFY